MRVVLIPLVAALGFSPVAASAETRPPSANPGWERVDAAMARKDYKAARGIAEELAAKGHPEAINGLAVFVGQGLGGPRDAIRERQLLERAVTAGSIGAKANLGRQLAAGSDESQWPRALSLLG